MTKIALVRVKAFLGWATLERRWFLTRSITAAFNPRDWRVGIYLDPFLDLLSLHPLPTVCLTAIIHAAPKCQHKGCKNDGLACFLPEDEKPSHWFCGEHAHEEGFCRGCGGFHAGIESFDFDPSGLCDNCKADAEVEDHTGLDDWRDMDQEDYP